MAEIESGSRASDTHPGIEGGMLGRREVWGMLIAASVIALLYLLLLARDSIPPEPKRGEPATPALRAALVVHTVEVQPRKANGEKWDVGIEGLPDPCVFVVNRTENTSRRTRKLNDTLKAVFDERTVSVKEGDEVYVRVDDIDVMADDLIGEKRFTVTREMIERGEEEMTFGQVKRLLLKFARRPE